MKEINRWFHLHILSCAPLSTPVIFSGDSSVLESTLQFNLGVNLSSCIVSPKEKYLLVIYLRISSMYAHAPSHWASLPPLWFITPNWALCAVRQVPTGCLVFNGGVHRNATLSVQPILCFPPCQRVCTLCLHLSSWPDLSTYTHLWPSVCAGVCMC